MRVILELGCWGRKEGDFVICSGVSNDILYLTKDSKRNSEICDYIDSHYGLFDKPLYSNVHTAVFNINEKFSEKGNPVFEDKFFRRIEEFCVIHKKCGTYLKLRLEE